MLAPLVYALWVARRWGIPLLVVCGSVLGLGYGSAHTVSRNTYTTLVGQTVEIVGRVKEDPTQSRPGAYSLQLDALTVRDFNYPGTVLVQLRASADIKRGDELYIVGELGEPFGSFPATVSGHTLSKQVRPVPGDIGRVVRDWFSDAVRRAIPEPAASLGMGFLTGQKSALSLELADALKIAGLTHIVVASGYNLTILVQASRRLFVRLSKYVSTVLSACLIACFMAVTGLSPSMTRAGLVSGMSLAAWYYGRRFHPFILLPIAAALTVAYQPSYVWGDLGWQLSFAAFVGVMVVSPLLQAYFFGPTQPGLVRQLVGETVAAHAVTVPIIALSFGTVSHVAIIANVLVVPFVPLAMLLTFVVGVFTLVGFPFVWIVAAPTTWLLDYMIAVATFVADLPWAQSDVVVPAWVWLGYAGLLGLACYGMWRRSSYSFQNGSNTLLG